MSTELAVRAKEPVAFTLADKITYAKALADASLLPEAYRRQPANVLLAMEYGEALGLPNASVAIQSIHIIEGKPSASAGLIASLVRRAGHRLRVTGDNQQARCEIVRWDDPDFPFVVEWTIQDAVNAGLVEIKNGRPYARDSKNRPKPWERFTASMLKARVVTQCARDACSEALNGVAYTPEEFGADVDAQGRPVIEHIPASAPVTAAEIMNSVPTVTVELLDDDREPATPLASLITDVQSRKLHAAFTAKGVTSRAARLIYASEFIDREIQSSKELTADEADRLITQIRTDVVTVDVETGEVTEPDIPPMDDADRQAQAEWEAEQAAAASEAVGGPTS